MKILLATDGSENSKIATKFVGGLAQQNEIDVTVLTVSYNPTQYSSQPWMPEWTAAEEERTRDLLDATRAQLGDRCRSLNVVHKCGATVPCILDQAAEIEADLIVVGAKGHSAIHRVLLGSVSDSVATHAKCSVLVVRPGTDVEKDSKRIVVGFDQSAASREAVAEFMDLKWDRASEVNVVSVVEQPAVFFGEGYSGPPIIVEPQQIEALQRNAERMASQIASMLPKTNTLVPTSSHVGSAIANVAEETKADLVLVGDTGHSLLGELLLGSTSKYLLRHAPCSVWISRHHFKADEAE
ncbi:universal stress protein [Aureliella helgolandensis]|uniref:Universal stress protein n=1 Tax=Aureliella helgolandensis TaxID=2527968 RepID=A0A518GCZ7_9BACT|nr:universal stress protein [Aureliella helgolandensis]QDV26471.1 Putative universal stress protein [Aureliella helgolandensis]